MSRTIASLAGLAGAAALVLALAGPAQASAPTQVYLPWNSGDAGTAKFSADPGDFEIHSPGDAVMACDYKADGWGVEATLIVNDHVRKVSTRGHASPYCSPWKTGDLVEEIPVILKACLVKGDQTGICEVSRQGET